MGNSPTLHSIVLNNTFNSPALHLWLMHVNCRRVRRALGANPAVIRDAYAKARISAALAEAIRSAPDERNDHDEEFERDIEFLEEMIFIAEAELADAEFETLQDEIEKRG
jgi:hypothetical protein